MTTPRELIAQYATQAQMSSFFIDKMGIVNVKSYGAVGDGVVDDTAAIQAAIDAMPNGGILFFPRGTYIISTALSITQDYIYILGAGARSVIKATNNVNGINVSNISNYFKMQDIWVTSAYDGQIGINATSIHNATFVNVKVSGFSSDGIKSTAGYLTSFDKCHIYENAGNGLNMVDTGVSFNNMVNIKNCNIAKNGGWNLVTDGSFIINIDGLGFEQKDTLNGVQTNGGIYITNPKGVSAKGLYYEPYLEGAVANFKAAYRAIKVGDFATTKLAQCVKLDTVLINNNAYGLVGIDFDYASDSSIENSNIRKCTTGINISSNSNRIYLDQNNIFDTNTVANITDSSTTTTYKHQLSSDQQVFSHVIDLSGAADTFLMVRAIAKMKIVDIKAFYSEASSADAGIIINVGTLSDADYYSAYTTEVNKSQWYVKTLPLSNTELSSGAHLVVASAGGKVGTGAIQIFVEYKLMV